MFIDYFMQERTINYQFSSRSTGLGECLLHPVPPGFRHLTIRSSATPHETRSSSPPCPPVFLPQPAAVSSHRAISPDGLRIFLNLPSLFLSQIGCLQRFALQLLRWKHSRWSSRRKRSRFARKRFRMHHLSLRG